MADTIKCRIFGEGASSDVNGVSITGVRVEGKQITSLDQIGLVPGVYTSNITYAQGECSGAVTVLPYELKLTAGVAPEIKVVPNIEQDGLVIPDFGVLNNDPPYAGQKVDTSNTSISATFGHGDRANSPWNKGDIPESPENGIANLIDGDRTTEWQFNQWDLSVDKQFVALSFEFGKATQVGNIRILGTSGSNIMR